MKSVQCKSNSRKTLHKSRPTCSCCITILKECVEEGAVNTHDLFLPMGELFEHRVTKINDDIWQRAGLPEQPTEHEEG